MLYPKPNTQYPILSIIIKEPDSAKSLTEYCPIMSNRFIRSRALEYILHPPPSKVSWLLHFSALSSSHCVQFDVFLPPSPIEMRIAVPSYSDVWMITKEIQM